MSYCKQKEVTGKSEEGYNKTKFYQHLAEDIGKKNLRRAIHEVTALMAVSETKEEFKMLCDRKYRSVVDIRFKRGYLTSLFLHF